MRQVTRAIVYEFIERRPKLLGNTHSTGHVLRLHGNAIAQWRGDELWISCGNYHDRHGCVSVTTRERLNALPGVSVTQSNWVTFLNSEPWDGSWTRVSGGRQAVPQLRDMPPDPEQAALIKAADERRKRNSAIMWYPSYNNCIGPAPVDPPPGAPNNNITQQDIDLISELERVILNDTTAETMLPPPLSDTPF